MNSYLRFSIITLFFIACVIYVLIPKYGNISISNKGWTSEDKQEFLISCIGNMGTEELCGCIMSKLQDQFISLDDMYRNSQALIETMQSASSECKK